jgi:hypothetical protein
LQLLLLLASAVILRSDYRGTHNHILLYQILDSPNLEGQVPVRIYIPQEQGGTVIPQALSSIFVASYDSQGEGIRPRLHKVKVKVTLRLTISQSVSKYWCRAPSGAHGQIFITV